MNQKNNLLQLNDVGSGVKQYKWLKYLSSDQ